MSERDAPDRQEDGDNVQERCIGHVGQSGSGKTFALEEDTLERHDGVGDSEDGPRRVFVDDRKREWTAIPAGVVVCEACVAPGAGATREKCQAKGECAIVSSLPDAEKMFAREETTFVVHRPTRDMRIGPPARGEIPPFERIAYWALNTGNLDLVFPEMQLHLPLEDDAAMGVQTRQLITQFRSYRIGIAWDSQQFASVSMRLRKQTNAWRLFGVAAGTPDMEQMRKLGGSALVDAVGECAMRHARGQPGWHVYCDPREPITAPKIRRY